MKRIIHILLFIFVVTLFTLPSVFAEDSETLTIKGSSVNKEITFSLEELKALTDGTYTSAYSSVNNFPTDKLIYSKGIKLTYLLDLAGVKENATKIKVTASDGYSKTFTYDQLIADDKYDYSSGKAKKVETIISYASSVTGMSGISDSPLTLVMGQRAENEQTHPWFVKYVSMIEVTDDDPGQWQEVTFTKKVTAEGVQVSLQHQYFNSVKIYYTADGSTPNINSKMYNLSTTNYQPELNKPILVSSNTVIKAIAIGAGKSDSSISSTWVNFDENAFTDLGGYEWAKTAIEGLAAKGVINGMGGGLFMPWDKLTRCQFAKMVVLALGHEPVKTYTSKFSDIKSGSWYTGYVLKSAELGFINGYTDCTFMPERPLSKEEMIKIAACVKGSAEEIERADTSIISAKSNISEWARKYVAVAENKGLIEHGHMAILSGAQIIISGTSTANRAEAASIIAAMIEQK